MNLTVFMLYNGIFLPQKKLRILIGMGTLIYGSCSTVSSNKSFLGISQYS